jgi:hypothetical protein
MMTMNVMTTVNANSNATIDNDNSNSCLVNKNFEHSFTVFTSRNWIVKENTENTISFYLKELFPYDDFSLSVDSDGKIDAIVPMWDSYRSISKLFDNYESANKYLCDKLDYYESTKNKIKLN